MGSNPFFDGWPPVLRNEGRMTIGDNFFVRGLTAKEQAGDEDGRPTGDWHGGSHRSGYDSERLTSRHHRVADSPGQLRVRVRQQVPRGGAR